MKWPETHVAEVAIHPIAKDPALGVAGPNLEIKPKTVRIHSRREVLFDPQRGETSYLKHPPTFVPTSPYSENEFSGVAAMLRYWDGTTLRDAGLIRIKQPLLRRTSPLRARP
jgi:hypothetical protein